jgi:hypothetical protein
MGGAQTHEQMNMVRRPTTGVGKTIRGANQSAEIFMQATSPIICDKRMAVLCMY